MTKIIQIVGYKNSGKTTLMNHLIRQFSEQKLKVGALKHHGHGGDIPLYKDTDSFSHFESGSLISGVQGESITQLTLHNLPLDELIDMYTSLSIELLLIEGYKHANYPKIVLLKNLEDISLLDELSNIIAVGSLDSSLLGDIRYPTFDLTKVSEHITQFATYIINN
ncbi:molybdopterin-guanine dinucleotide biosynthesis protein B [Virgibacillus necropolis]|uniref:molybdopterin-guanine dinucleotide biosynthesis protein B n=1 Tax=Virgibacillus necropolis TaxID=163877 RepID=UPI003850A6DC